MQRGVKAYVECRIEAAEIYFSAALDVVEVRAGLTSNAIFSEMQWRKPAEFLLNMWLGMGERNKVLRLTQQIASLPSLCSGESLSQFRASVEGQLASVMAEPQLQTNYPLNSAKPVLHSVH